jgi:hypothetical protein
MLAVPSLPAVAFAPFLFENEDLFRLRLADDLAGNFGVGNDGRADLYFAVIADEQNVPESNSVAHFTGKLFNFDDVAFGDTVLLATRSNYGILHNYFSKSYFLKQKTAKVNLTTLV